MKHDHDDKLRIQIEQDLRKILTELQLLPSDLLHDFTLKIEYFQKQEGLEHNWGYSRKKKRVWVALWGPDLSTASRYLIAHWYREYQKKNDPSFLREHKGESSLLLLTALFIPSGLIFSIKNNYRLIELGVFVIPSILLLDLYVKYSRFIDMRLNRQKQLLMKNKEKHGFSDMEIEEYVRSFWAFEATYKMVFLAFLVFSLLISVGSIFSYIMAN